MSEFDRIPDEPVGTTTHAQWGAGNPHLVVFRSESDRFMFNLTDDDVAIGSGGDCALRLPEADALHARIEHDERDEYVLTMYGAGETNADMTRSGQHAGDHTETLRTGAQFTIGPWRLVYMREEFADHGRPFGGRQGGEYSDQPPQPARPDYHSGKAAPESRGWEVQED